MEEFILEIHEIDFGDGAGEGGVEPLEVVGGEEILPEGIVDEDAVPLAALGLVAGDGHRVFELQGVEERVFPHGVVALFLGGEVRVIGADALIQGIGLLVGKRRGLGIQGVQEDLRDDLLVLIVRKCEPRVGEMEAVALLVTADLDQFADIAVGNVVRSFQLVGKVVAVLDDHEFVLADEALLAELHLRADTRVVAVRPLVGSAKDHRFVFAVTAIGIGKGLDQLTARNPFYIRESGDGKA